MCLTPSYGYKDIFPFSQSGTIFLDNAYRKHHPGQGTCTPTPLTTKLSQFKTSNLTYLIKIAFNFIIYHPRKRKKSILKSKQVMFMMLFLQVLVKERFF